MAATINQIKEQIKLATKYRRESKTAAGFYELEEKAGLAKEAYDEALNLFRTFILESKVASEGGNITNVELIFDEPNDGQPSKENDTVVYEVIITDKNNNQWVYDLVKRFMYLRNCLLPLNEGNLIKVNFSYFDVYEDENKEDDNNVETRSKLKEIIDLAYEFYTLYKS